MYNNVYTLLPMLALTTPCSFVFNGIVLTLLELKTSSSFMFIIFGFVTDDTPVTSSK